MFIQYFSITYNLLMAILRGLYAYVSQMVDDIVHYISQEPQFPVFDNTILAFVVSSLLNILQLIPDSPFKTHPKTMFIVSISLLMYGVSCDVEKRYSHTNVEYVNIVRHGSIMFGSLLVICLISILVPSVLQRLVFLVYILFFAYRWIGWLLDEVEGNARV